MNDLARGPETPLTNAKGAFSSSLAEYALLAMLHFDKQVTRLQANRQGKKWERFTMSVLKGKAVGFIGFGDIAKATARLCKAFDMRILALRNSHDLSEEGLVDVVYYSDENKLEIFRQSDFLVCSLPGGAPTYHFCGAEEFAAVKPSSVFISVGRGSAIDESALATALQCGALKGAALDVFETEPLPESSPLWSFDNIIISSHNADLTSDYMDLCWAGFENKLDEFLSPDFVDFNSTVDKMKGY